MSSSELTPQQMDRKRIRERDRYANMSDEKKNSRIESQQKRRKISKENQQRDTDLSPAPAAFSQVERVQHYSEEIPACSVEQIQQSQPKRAKRKGRSELTPEQLERRRQYDRDRYRKLKENANAIKSTNEEPVLTEGPKQRTYAKRAIEKSKYIAMDGNNKPMEYYLGRMEHECQHCSALHFETESNFRKQFSSCCKNGKVVPNPMTPYPEPLLSWLTKDDEAARHFRTNIRKYNSAFAFASFSYTPSPKTPRGGPKTFVIHGQVYHLTSTAATASTDKEPVYSQLYFMDPEFAIDARLQNAHNLKCQRKFMEEIQVLMESHNAYAKAYKMMNEVMKTSDSPDIRMFIVKDQHCDPRRYNLPTVSEVAAVFISKDGQPEFERDICVYPQNQDQAGTQRMSVSSPNLDPMTYPVLFPHGDFGWQYKLKGANDNLISQQQFYSHRLQERKTFNPLLHAGKLTQQFIVDSFLKVEARRLEWIRLNQTKLRVESYLGLMDYVNTKADEANLKAGKVFILPSSFGEGKRALQQNYQDAMTLVAVHGKPDLFITFTCNPKWKEISEQLLPGETSIDRPDLTSTVFHLKLKEFMNDLLKNHVFGKVKAFVYVIEFQKRGLPHVHILLILVEDDKLKEPNDVNMVVCAEIPDKEQDPELYEIISTCMMHGPCGESHPSAPCMEIIEGKPRCTKNFPKDIAPITSLHNDGYPLYRRRKDGRTVTKNDVEMDNCWVVPYNPYLSRKYNAHINVEVCSSVKSVKYIFKYIYKGHDAAVVKVSETGEGTYGWDEITSYLDTRYIAAPEAMWRLREYKMHDKSHTVKRLAVHLPLMHNVVFRQGDEQRALENKRKEGTTLTAWFQLNLNNPDARQYLYTEIPYHYVYVEKSGEYIKRTLGHEKVLPRIYSVSPRDTERFCLRLLLLHVRGATSYEDLRTVSGVVFDSFKDAAKALNLLDCDENWINTMEEATAFKMPSELRLLLATIFVFGYPTNTKELYEMFKEALFEDYIKLYRDPEIAEQLALRDIEEHLSQFGKDCKDFGLPTPRFLDADNNSIQDIIRSEEESLRLLPLLNEDQRSAYDRIMDAIYGKTDSNCFFLSGCGGSGKTFLYAALTATVLSKGDKVKSVAPTGLAATLLKNGQTVHSGFRLPLKIDDSTVSQIKQTSKEFEILKKTKLIVWDEISMCSAHMLDAVDRSLRDLFDCIDKPFGGIAIVIGGDFRQQAPVIVHGNRVKIVESSVKSSKIWRNFTNLRLTKNMRVQEEEVQFVNWLLSVGSGLDENEEKNDFCKLPKEVLSENVVHAVFGTDVNMLSIEELASCAILCPKNDDTLRMNERILAQLDGEMVTYYSTDTITNCQSEEERQLYPVEFLNSLTPMGMPPHQLNLKKGCCVMLLRNMNPKRGLCNGTRLVVEKLGANIIDCTIFTGDQKGCRVFVPRMTLDVSDNDLPFELRRKQFPLRLAYSMTITKSQGQTFEKIGVYLPQPVFTHGQLYTALSRVKSKKGLAIQIKEGQSQGKIFQDDDNVYCYNCVYSELL